ncbi:MAG: tRNA (adenosine(37)-N6)-threonylcarbamoyltransferase complex ATPase subunit type 1 TsaE [Butyricimonas paravirosa]
MPCTGRWEWERPLCVKAVAGCLGIEDDVNSPTFAIVNEYLTATGDSVFH